MNEGNEGDEENKETWPERTYGEEQKEELDDRMMLPDALKDLPKAELKMIVNRTKMTGVIERYIEDLSKLNQYERETLLHESPLPFIIRKTDTLITTSKVIVVSMAREIGMKVGKVIPETQDFTTSIDLTRELARKLDAILMTEESFVNAVQHIDLREQIQYRNILVYPIENDPQQLTALSKNIHLFALRTGAMITDNIRGLHEQTINLSSNFDKILQILELARKELINMKDYFTQDEIAVAEKDFGYEEINYSYKETHKDLIKFLKIFLIRHKFVIKPAHELLITAYRKSLPPRKIDIESQIRRLLESLDE